MSGCVRLQRQATDSWDFAGAGKIHPARRRDPGARSRASSGTAQEFLPNEERQTRPSPLISTPRCHALPNDQRFIGENGFLHYMHQGMLMIA